MKKQRVLTTLGRWASALTMCVLVGGLSRPAHAVTMTFDAGFGEPHSYTENGMTVASHYYPGGGGHIHLGDNSGDGSPDLKNHSGCCSNEYEFTFGGTPFDLVSFDVVKISDLGAANTFIASSGATVSVGNLGTFVLPGAGWSGITSFEWQQALGKLTIDNLVFASSQANPSATPEPSTIALLGTGLVGLLAYGWRRRTQVN